MNKLFLTLVLALPFAARAELKLPAIIGDHMVLQQKQTNPIWGWDAPGTKVTVKFAGQTRSAEAGQGRSLGGEARSGAGQCEAADAGHRGIIPSGRSGTCSSARCGCAPASRTWDSPWAVTGRATSRPPPRSFRTCASSRCRTSARRNCRRISRANGNHRTPRARSRSPRWGSSSAGICTRFSACRWG